MASIFISYCHVDQLYARRLADALAKKGFEIWFDLRVNPGRKWSQEIEANLDNCGAVIVVMTSAARQSKWVENEVLRALRRKKDIFPLLLEGEQFFPLESTHHHDVRDGRLPGPDFYQSLSHAVAPAPSVSIDGKAHSLPEIPSERASVTRKRLTWLAGVAVGVPALVLYMTWAWARRRPAEPTADPLLVPSASATLSPPAPVDSVPPVVSARPVAPPLASSPLLELVEVPAGEFWMGAIVIDGNTYDDEIPRHRVKVSRFLIGKREVSNAEYRQFQRAHIGEGDQAATRVSWFEAKRFCESLGMRLPTEAEWEYAARGTDGRQYPWGREPPDPQRAAYPHRAPVDSYRQSAGPFGTLHQAGNVAEWVADCYEANAYKDDAEKGQLVDPLHDSRACLYRVYRGGSFNSEPGTMLRSMVRSFTLPDERSKFIGFRCARTSRP